ncbi:helix-turn-helix domain-containing protein [Actinoplanes flavus]|uniref:Helix-turn-helix domain-containing protein n=1 Tax=Actinoplanes flavus TaxID=2820290 RepID=A0ABS3UD52_9ACTN|nr:helix-turn-helix domain-containing protein [Actinoplanes flavus]MBO3736705.1 helix-turn-helix domain-containing protein [Actinoplanes flavus]
MKRPGNDATHVDPDLGAVLRRLRSGRRLTLDAVTRRVGCAPSLLSQVETGRRSLAPWLATALDLLYDTGGAITALADTRGPGDSDRNVRDLGEDVVLVLIPGRGIRVPISRRELLAAAGIGAVGGTLLAGLQHATEDMAVDEEVLAGLETTLTGLQNAARVMAPARLIRPLTAQVALAEVLHRRAPPPLRARFGLVLARYDESLSWMAEESGDLPSALYWTDRTEQWAHHAGWPGMAAYTHVRRSMLAISHAGDGVAAVEQAQRALRVPAAPARVRALAYKQIAYGYALNRRPDQARYALDQTAALFQQPDDSSSLPTPGQASVPDDDLLSIFTATCDVYLGAGNRAIDTLSPRLPRISASSARTSAITTAKLAQAHAHAGAPGLACQLILNVLDTTSTIPSRTTITELRRALPVLARWPDRDDVREVTHRLAG